MSFIFNRNQLEEGTLVDRYNTHTQVQNVPYKNSW